MSKNNKQEGIRMRNMELPPLYKSIPIGQREPLATDVHLRLPAWMPFGTKENESFDSIKMDGSGVRKTQKTTLRNSSGLVVIGNVSLRTRHRDILDVILTSGIPELSENKNLRYIVDSRLTQKRLGMSSYNNVEYFYKYLLDMKNAEITYYIGSTDQEIQNLIKYRKGISVSILDEIRRLGNGKFEVELNNNFRQLFMNNIGVHYEARVKDILGIPSEIGRSVARYCMSHKFVNKRLIKPKDECHFSVFDEVGMNELMTTKRTVHRARRELTPIIDIQSGEDSNPVTEYLRKRLGIDIRMDSYGELVVYYKKLTDVIFRKAKIALNTSF